MRRKIVLKRLSASDLTLFEHHYRNTSGTKQKAINLDAAVFIDALFPTLPERMAGLRDRVILTLSIYGPGGAGAHTITRKVLKQQKNWRLNGELIFDPPEEPARYDSLAKDDYAILDFSGDPEPHTARMCLIARAITGDSALHDALHAKYESLFTPRKGMVEIEADDLAMLLNGLDLPTGHPALDFIDFDALEDAAQGGLEGLKKLRRRRQTRGVSREELGRARQNAEQIGRLGEEILNSWLGLTYRSEAGSSFRWESDENAVAPYDFTILEHEHDTRRIDAKSTAGDFRNPIHVSVAELDEMANGGLPYDLYRLYSVSESYARLRIAENLGQFAASVLNELSGLPQGVTIDGISIKPESLNFGEEITLDLTENEGDEEDTPDLSEI